MSICTCLIILQCIETASLSMLEVIRCTSFLSSVLEKRSYHDREMSHRHPHRPFPISNRLVEALSRIRCPFRTYYAGTLSAFSGHGHDLQNTSCDFITPVTNPFTRLYFIENLRKRKRSIICVNKTVTQASFITKQLIYTKMQESRHSFRRLVETLEHSIT